MRSLHTLAGSVSLAALVVPLSASAQAILLDPIIYSANRAPSEAAETGASVSVLTGAGLERDGRPFVLQQITDLPGVTISQNGPAGSTSGFAIRGAPQQYVRVQVDGIEISDPTAPQVTPYLNGLLVDDFSRVEVLKGSQSALYGGQAVGGVITLDTPRPTEPGLGGRLILEGGGQSTFRGAGTVSGLGEKGEFALTIARFQTDGFSAAEEADGNTEDDDYQTTRISGSGRIYVSDNVNLLGSGFWQKEEGDYDETEFGVPVDAFSTYETTTYGLRGGVEIITDSGVSNTLALSYFDVDSTRNARNPAFGDSTYDTDGERARAEYVGSWTASDATTLQWGADVEREKVRTFSSSSFGDLRFDDDDWIAGAFVQSTIAMRDNLFLDATARADNHSEFGFYPTGRLTLAWLPQPDTTIRGSLGTGFRAPSIYELYAPDYGNPDLEPETSVSADLGVTHRFSDGRGEASATLFWLQIDDLIESDAQTFVYSQNGATAESKGVELAAGWTFSEALVLTGGYTYTDAKADGDRRNRIPRHDLALAVTGQAFQRLSYDVNASFIWDFYDESIDFDSNGFAENYWVANARVAYAITDAAEVYVRAENLFDEQYQTARGYGTQDRIFYAGVAAAF